MNKGGLFSKLQATLYNSFVKDCIDAIYLGYDKMLKEGGYELYWVEDKLTAHLIIKIQETNHLLDKNIYVCPQFPLYDNDVIYGDGNPANAPVIDFKFGQLWKEREVSFFAEAKNLSAKNWQKPEGARVSSSYYNNRYIETGIFHYLSGYYPKGCLLGYVVNGNTSSVLEGINKIIANKTYKIHHDSIENLGVITRDDKGKWQVCHQSSNQVLGKEFILQHLMLDLV